MGRKMMMKRNCDEKNDIEWNEGERIIWRWKKNDRRRVSDGKKMIRNEMVMKEMVWDEMMGRNDDERAI